jgi:hypothetical protein
VKGGAVTLHLSPTISRERDQPIAPDASDSAPTSKPVAKEQTFDASGSSAALQGITGKPDAAPALIRRSSLFGAASPASKKPASTDPAYSGAVAEVMDRLPDITAEGIEQAIHEVVAIVNEEFDGDPEVAAQMLKEIYSCKYGLSEAELYESILPDEMSEILSSILSDGEAHARWAPIVLDKIYGSFIADRQRGKSFSALPDHLKTPEAVERLCGRDHAEPLEYLRMHNPSGHKKLLSDSRKVFKIECSKNPDLISYELAEKWIEKDPTTLTFVPYEFKTELYKLAVGLDEDMVVLNPDHEYDPDLDRDQALEIISRRPELYEKLSRRMRFDPEIRQAAMYDEGMVKQFAGQIPSDDIESARHAVSTHPPAIHDLPDRFKYDARFSKMLFDDPRTSKLAALPHISGRTGRYSDDLTLRALETNRSMVEGLILKKPDDPTHPSKPILLFVEISDSADESGAATGSGLLRGDRYGEATAQGYIPVHYVVKSVEEITKVIKRYLPMLKKGDVVNIRGHSDGSSMVLSEGETLDREDPTLDVADMERIQGHFQEEDIPDDIALTITACSSGQSLGPAMYNLFHKKWHVYAPLDVAMARDIAHSRSGERHIEKPLQSRVAHLSPNGRHEILEPEHGWIGVVRQGLVDSWTTYF